MSLLPSLLAYHAMYGCFVAYCCIRGNIYSIEYCNSLISVIAFIEQNTSPHFTEQKIFFLLYCKFPERTERKSGANKSVKIIINCAISNNINNNNNNSLNRRIAWTCGLEIIDYYIFMIFMLRYSWFEKEAV